VQCSPTAALAACCMCSSTRTQQQQCIAWRAPWYACPCRPPTFPAHPTPHPALSQPLLPQPLQAWR
jgi:hypothetical protein